MVEKTTAEKAAGAAGVFLLGGEFTIHRLGFGSMRLTGQGVWGEPADRAEAIRVLKCAAELGIDFIDTADSYGPYVAEELISEALHPYPDNLVIATKAGFVRTGPGKWTPLGRPEYLRQECEMSLRRLRLERIPLFQLHRIDPKTPLEDQIGELDKLRAEGKIDLIGLSEVSVSQIEESRKVAEIASVQNHYNLVDRQSESVLEYCERQGLGFIPYFPVATGSLSREDSPVSALARELGCTRAQLALAWLLRRSPVMLPIPGTSSVEHIKENAGAAEIRLTDEQFRKLSEAGASS